MTQEEVLFKEVRSKIRTVRDLADYLNLESEHLDILDKALVNNGWERPVNCPETIAVDVCRNECVTAAEIGYTVSQWIPNVCGNLKRKTYTLELVAISEEDCQSLMRFWERKFGKCYKVLYNTNAKIGRWYADKPSEIYRLVFDTRWRDLANWAYVGVGCGALVEKTIETFCKD